jgi:carbamoyl-phosphate synthase large subunit
LAKIQDGTETILDFISSGQVSLMINTPAMGKRSTAEAARIRRACIETGVACVTTIDTAAALARALDYFEDPDRSSCMPYDAYLVPEAVVH